MTSHCQTDSRREEYVKNINKTVRVTFEGSCAETWEPGRRRTKDGKRRGTALGVDRYLTFIIITIGPN